MVRAALGFLRSAICGMLLTLFLPVLLVVLLCGWLDQDTSWAVKWLLTVFGPFATALYWILFKIFRTGITGRKASGIWSTALVFIGTAALIALLVRAGVYSLRD
jgi:hypothetical protein